MPYLIAAVIVIIAGLILALAHRGLKAAHRRPQPYTAGSAIGDGHGALPRVVITAVTSVIRLGIRLGIRVGPIMMLTVRGRKSQLPRTNLVDVFELNGRSWLMATHSSQSQWVRNLRAAGEGGLARGRRRLSFRAAELPLTEAPDVLEAVLGPRLARPIAGFVLRDSMGLQASANRDDYAVAAEQHPVFDITITKTETARPTLSVVLIGVGLVVGLVHTTLGLTSILTTGQWVSGVVIGLLIAGLGNHLRIFRRASCE